ncbi:MAG: hypothetical protein SO101_13175 [Lachnospiraceae bacterium]|nr:hypothetical protein [Lachnospiraceae bacterium]
MKRRREAGICTRRRLQNVPVFDNEKRRILVKNIRRKSTHLIDYSVLHTLIVLVCGYKAVGIEQNFFSLFTNQVNDEKPKNARQKNHNRLQRRLFGFRRAKSFQITAVFLTTIWNNFAEYYQPKTRMISLVIPFYRVIKFLHPERYNTIEVNDYAGR